MTLRVRCAGHNPHSLHVAHKPTRSFVVFQGERSQQLENGVRAVPYRTFLRDTLPALAEK